MSAPDYEGIELGDVEPNATGEPAPALTGPVLDPDDGAAASKRAVRTLLQNVAVDVLVAVVLVLYPIASGAASLADFDWPVLGFLVGKTILVTVLSFVMRRFKVVPSTL